MIKRCSAGYTGDGCRLTDRDTGRETRPQKVLSSQISPLLPGQPPQHQAEGSPFCSFDLQDSSVALQASRGDLSGDLTALVFQAASRKMHYCLLTHLKTCQHVEPRTGEVITAETWWGTSSKPQPWSDFISGGTVTGSHYYYYYNCD